MMMKSDAKLAAAAAAGKDVGIDSSSKGSRHLTQTLICITVTIDRSACLPAFHKHTSLTCFTFCKLKVLPLLSTTTSPLLSPLVSIKNWRLGSTTGANDRVEQWLLHQLSINRRSGQFEEAKEEEEGGQSNCLDSVLTVLPNPSMASMRQ